MREFLSDLSTSGASTPEIAREADECLAEFPSNEAFEKHAFSDERDANVQSALERAFKLVRFAVIDAGCLTAEQMRVRPYVLRHYPICI